MPTTSDVRRIALVLILIACSVPAAGADSRPDPGALAAKIDARLAAGWERAKVAPAPVIDDATFARRAYLDLVGRIPTAAEARGFVADRAPNKRAELVRQLVGTGAHTRHAAAFWRRTWVPQSETGEYSRLAEEIEDWLAERLRSNTPYDKLAIELLAPPERAERTGPWRFFYSASEYLPENLAASTTRAFLGVNLDCAQCHDHPFARWTRDQFWQTAAFFAKPTEEGPLELAVPNTKRTATPVFLSDEEPKWPERVAPSTGPRALAAWVTARDNPYFAKNAANRLWAEFFGTGLIEPLDDLSGQNPASHPELLDELARAFADSGFDLKYLTTALATTHAYQLASTAPRGKAPSDPRLFARAPVRGLTGVQLYDSLRVAAGYPPERSDLDPAEAARERRRFAGRFRIDRPAEAERSVTQSLALINGQVAADLTDPARSPALVAAADAPFLDARGRVETLFFAALGRPPAAEELAQLVRHVESGGAHKDPKGALGDVFWALLNSSEFNTNH
ncbi:DUF1549 domain-containing protein [Gemmata sp. G18]|uniref:DUF1549 domain-containing protein n=1 Tax=Gemmata palustris TaxID=2822762 RepID=A0ABS5BJ95_9BACT|nr:DUF1549 and DUF1553 domain-containing protein [Gemmata palustris]MBP3953745.1 DUF1549 domain-containing protein [Gemmata palustris]